MKSATPLLATFCYCTYFMILSPTMPVQGQSIQIDGTTKTSINFPVPESCQDTCTIFGGKRHGNNLFHSFEEFNVDSGATVLFVDPAVQNILSRVTGKSSSNISGTLGVIGGDANLFLINPNGILFGPESNLDLQGSFIATTANAVQFGDQQFSSTSASEIPIITINPSALFFQTINESIINSSVDGLSVLSGRSLHLIGGDVMLDGGEISSFGGRIELGGLAAPGIINILPDTEGFSLEFPNNILKSNVLLTSANIDVTGEEGGNLIINANDIEVEGSRLRAGIDRDLGTSLTQSGDIELNAEKTVKLSDESTIVNRPRSRAKGQGGNTIVNSKNLYLTQESKLEASTFGKGNAGNVILNVQETISLDLGFVISNSDTSANFRSTGNSGRILIKTNKLNLNNESQITAGVFGSGNAQEIVIHADDVKLSNFSGIISNVEAGGIGNAGEIHVFTDTLTLRSGSQLTTSVLRPLEELPGGIGKGGDIYVEASEAVDISGVSDIDGFESGILTITENGAMGPAGNITITTGTFRITDGALVSAETFNSGKGGDIKIIATNFQALGGGQITTSTFNSGPGGNIKLDVLENIVLAGEDLNFNRNLTILRDSLTELDGIDLEITQTLIQNKENIGPQSGLYASALSGASGESGSISIDPRVVSIQNGARISVDNDGTGLGGNVTLQSGTLNLNRGLITATSESNTGGNITLSIDDLLLLRNNSEISTSAENDGTGGNIKIGTSLLAAFPNENSDITANAEDGAGGQITITANNGIFGLEVQDELTESSDITAISINDPDLNGDVEINNPEVDPSDSLLDLPEVVEPPQEVAKGCRTGATANNSSFIHTGRGGLPPGPHEAQTPATLWQDLRAHNLQATTPAQTPTTRITPPTHPKIIEAKGWVKDPQGRIHLSANVPQPTQTPQPTTAC